MLHIASLTKVATHLFVGGETFSIYRTDYNRIEIYAHNIDARLVVDRDTPSNYDVINELLQQCVRELAKPSTVSVDHLIEAAQLLRSESGENPEYDRALVELIMDALCVSHDEYRERMTTLVLGSQMDTIRDLVQVPEAPRIPEPNEAKFCVEVDLVEKRLRRRLEQVGHMAVVSYDELYKMKADIVVLNRPMTEKIRDEQCVVACEGGEEGPKLVLVNHDKGEKGIAEYLEGEGYAGPWIWFDETHEDFEVMRRLCKRCITL